MEGPRDDGKKPAGLLRSRASITFFEMPVKETRVRGVYFAAAQLQISRVSLEPKSRHVMKSDS